jgi:O-methyltransferase
MGALGRGTGTWYRRGQSLRFALTRDRGDIARFLTASRGVADARRRVAMLLAFERITNAVRGYHTLGEMLRVCGQVLLRPNAIVVEAGCGKGSSTAKLSLAVRAVGGHLHVFDSFRGLPANAEVHTNLDGRTVRFHEGAFRGRLRQVQRTVEQHGAIDVCTFHKGWFADTMPGFERHVDVAVFDVDLIASTRECLVHILPNLVPDGVAFSQDGHLRATTDLVADESFWRSVGIEAPIVSGLGTDKLLEFTPR